GEFTAIDDVSFSVNPGEVFGWLGPNGAGKTTTIRIMLGLMQPTSGATFVLGFNSAAQPKAIHAHIGYMSQQFTLYNDLTPWENIRLYGMIQGLSGEVLHQRQEEIIRMAGLEGHEHALTGTLSGGWKQRLALGCAIVHRPKVVFLDEPTAGVDPISRREFWELIYAMAKDGVTILVTTHYMDEAELCQKVGFISQGRLVALDSPETLKVTHMRGQVIEITSPQPDRLLQRLKTAQTSGNLPIEEVALYGSQVHIVLPEAGSNFEKVRAYLEKEGLPLRRMEHIAPTLEDVFISAVR
ncbi:MAG TPA: ABC transporter ATP-binding protein, partial [Anaerolineales bacterium]